MSGKPLTPSKITAFRNAIETCQLADQQRLQLQLQRLLKRLQTNKPADQMADRLQLQIDRSLACVTQRAQTRPVLSFPEELPITGHLGALVKAVQKNSVVVIAGETGSGKSTQIPKICLKAGLGLRGEIAMTQPRRIAARSIASRLAEETQTAMGDVVGYQVRFDQQVSEQTRVRVMTDGLLLAQTRDDPGLTRYDTIIIDEAHERSLNIDFLLGVVKRLLQQRDNLKVIITSATIDTEKFAHFFDDAPVFTVSGRGYPVEILYDESAAQEERDTTQAVVDAVKTLQSRMPSGDILAFFAGERDIREGADALAKAGLKDTEVLPLYARLGRAEQQRIFHPGELRRVVLATNVAETSLTVPRIHAVIDTGFARISRYSPRSKVQRLPIEPISQASANQRAGRCGRLGPGICVRLYDEQDFLDRPEFTEPEIQRTGLASVILHMLVMRLGEIESFPFVDAPSRALIKDGYQLLRELDALDAHNDVTPIGRQLARLPLDVRYARMLVAARSLDCVDAVLTIVAGLSIQDPRERPHQATQEADQAHARFADPRSDFASLLRLYGAFEKQRIAAGSAAVKRWCHQHFVHFLRMREWRDLRRQLSDLIKDANWQWQVPDEPDLDKTHQACLAGLLSHVGRKEPDKHFSGVRQRQFYLFPGSVLAKKPPKWVMAAEIVETSQTFARVNAPIDPAWIEQLAPDLLKHTTFDPHWSDNKQQAMAYEQVSLFGLVIVEKRRVALAPTDPAAAREIFIRDGLVGQKLRSNLPFYQFNVQLREQLETLEHQSRRRDILVEEARLVDFYDHRLGAEVVHEKSLKRWCHAQENDQKLRLDKDILLSGKTEADHARDFQTQLHMAGLSFPLQYRFEPGHERDGVTVQVSLAYLNQLDDMRLEWLVPGLLEEKVTALIKSLPKSRRRLFVPVPDHARKVIAAVPFAKGDLLQEIAAQLSGESGLRIQPDEFNIQALDAHLRFGIELLDDCKKPLAYSRDIQVLQKEFSQSAHASLSSSVALPYQRTDLSDWPADLKLPEQEQIRGAVLYPALRAGKLAAEVWLAEDRTEAEMSHREGLMLLFKQQLADKIRYLQKKLPLSIRARLTWQGIDSDAKLATDLAGRAIADLLPDQVAKVRSRQAFQTLLDAIGKQLIARVSELTKILEEALLRYTEVAVSAESCAGQYPQASADMLAQLGYLFYPGMMTEIQSDLLREYPRYLEALRIRQEKLDVNPAKDASMMAAVGEYWQPFMSLYETHQEYPRAMQTLHRLIEEYRVSLFAQSLGTKGKVSPKLLDTALDEARFRLTR